MAVEIDFGTASGITNETGFGFGLSFGIGSGIVSGISFGICFGIGFGIQKTIQLPTKKCDALITLLQDMNKKRDISVEDFQIIQGKTTICIHWDSI